MNRHREEQDNRKTRWDGERQTNDRAGYNEGQNDYDDFDRNDRSNRGYGDYGPGSRSEPGGGRSDRDDSRRRYETDSSYGYGRGEPIQGRGGRGNSQGGYQGDQSGYGSFESSGDGGSRSASSEQYSSGQQRNYGRSGHGGQASCGSSQGSLGNQGDCGGQSRRDFDQWGYGQSSYGQGRSGQGDYEQNVYNQGGGYGQSGRGSSGTEHRGGYDQQTFYGQSGYRSQSGSYGNPDGYGSQSGSYGSSSWGRGSGSNVFGGSSSTRRSRGPKGYTRSDDRIKEDLSDRLMQSDIVDASDVEIEVKDGVVTLSGTIDSRQSKYFLDELAESVGGVKDVNNQLRVKRSDTSSSESSTTSSSGSSSSSDSAREDGNSATATGTGSYGSAGLARGTRK